MSRLDNPDRIIRLDNIYKNYGETIALHGLSLSVQPGEILGIAGPNGAGKSTTVRILAGETSEAMGAITIGGRPWGVADRRSEVVVVHQEPELYPTLTVGENLLIGQNRSKLLWPRVGAGERDLLAELGLDDYIARPVDSCSLVVWQLTEIAKALGRAAKLFVFDEPNSALTEAESKHLFDYLLRLRRDAKASIILISHRLPDLVEYSDRVAIIRDGYCCATLEGSDLTAEAIAVQLVSGGRKVDRPDRQNSSTVSGEETTPSGIVAKVRNWSHPHGIFDVAEFDIPSGRVIALSGVEGSGAREFLRSIAGVEKANGQQTIYSSADVKNPNASIQYVAASRTASLFPNFSVVANLALRRDWRHITTRFGRLSQRMMGSTGKRLIDEFRIKTGSEKAPLGALSGGNQQKVALAAAMGASPRLLIVEEPTRGVDIGTKAEIYSILRAWAASGNAVLALCTEVPEIYALADEVVVVSRGHVNVPVPIAGLTVTDLAAIIERVARGETA